MSYRGDCPIPGCGRGRFVNQLMCKKHWFRVPLILRRAVWDTYAETQKKHGRDAIDAACRHRTACTQAVNAVCRKLGIGEPA